jgi:hypothetical protein
MTPGGIAHKVSLAASAHALRITGTVACCAPVTMQRLVLGGRMARRLASRLSVAAVLGATFVFGQACGGSDGGTPGGDEDTGVPGSDGTSSDSSGKDSSAVDSGGADSAVKDTSPSDGSGGDTTPSDGSGTDTAPPVDGGGACAPAACGADTDCDGISDAIEGRFATGKATDTDSDGTPDYQDLDSDGDTIPDRVEWRTPGCVSPTAEDNDADGDGTPNFQDTDADDNGLPDKDEACPPGALKPAGCDGSHPADFDGDGVLDFLDFDNDHDSGKADKTLGLGDKRELSNNASPPVYVGISIDTDGDGTPDVYDIDSDNDFIPDLEDGTTDPDADSIPNFRDVDSDGDKVPDACEARAKASPTIADYPLALKDTNANGIFDYVDLDSDGDFLADGAEDKNFNCVLDAAETDRINPDTDGDGTGDLAEVALDSTGAGWARDPAMDPTKAGKFYFIEPYSVDGSAKPTPTSTKLALSTSLKKGDVGFMVDTSISMDEEITALRNSLVSTIIPALSSKFTDLGIGVAAHDDYPVTSASNTAGGTISKPYYISATGYVSTDFTKAQTAMDTLVGPAPTFTPKTHPGGDLPESQVAAMMHAIHGDALTWTGTFGGTVPLEAPPAGTFGGMHFRTDALAILIPITDASMHDGKQALNVAPTGGAGDYSSTYQFPYGSDVTTRPNVDDLVAKINAIGAKVIGVASGDNDRTVAVTNPNEAYGALAYLADQTGSYVPKSAFSTVPASCKTGLDDGSVAPDGPGGTCRLVFQIHTNGSGLSNSIINGVKALLNAIAFDVHVRAYKDPLDTGAVDPVDAFLESIPPEPTGGTDPVTKGICVTFSSTQLADKYMTPKAVLPAGDIKETITGLNPGKLYCFSVVPKPNTTVTPKTTPQTFRALLDVVADKAGGTSLTLGAPREVLFIVPPSLN